MRLSRRRRPAAPDPAAHDPEEIADIDTRLAAIYRGSAERDRRLATRLQPLVERGVPPRWFEPATGLAATRLRFADGTTVLVRGDVSGDASVLAMTMQRRSVPPVACRVDVDGAHLVFRVRRRELSILVTGMDQPD